VRILYGMSSPNVRKVLILLEELGLPYECRHVAVFTGENLDAEFRGLNPFAKVPVLVEDELPEPIFESGAILVYLAETYGPEFLPPSGPARWEALKWLFAQVANVGPMFGQHSHFRYDPGRAPYAAERYRRTAAELYRILDRRLGERPWLAGDAYSVADIATYPWARYLRRHGMNPDDLPNLTAWMAKIAARGAVVRAAEKIAELGALDTRDRKRATEEDQRRFAWMHFPAPTAEEAAGARPPRRGSGGEDPAG
jgi:GST-like protein